MYTPINWANPNKLEIIKEKRDLERSNKPQISEVIRQKKEIKTKWFDTLNRVFAFKLKPTFDI